MAFTSIICSSPYKSSDCVDYLAYTNTSATEAKTSADVGNYILKGLDSESSGSGGVSSPSTTTTTTTPTYSVFIETAFTATITSNWPIYGNVLTVTPGADSDATSTAMQCWSEIATWRNQSASFWNSRVANRTWEVTSFPFSATDTWSATSTIYPANVSTYTLCDGSPRANIRPKTTTLSGTTTLWGSSTTTLMPTFRPQPCTLGKRDCQMLYFDTDIVGTDDLELLAQCGNPAHLGEKPSCLVGGGPVDLIYFPVQRNDSAICGSKIQATAATTAKTMISGLSEITALGRTFTSDSVYISFKTLFATIDGFWDTVGPTFTDLIVPLHSSDISSHCGGWHNAYGPGTPLNYADLNWPVPASAYKCQYRCSVQVSRSATLLGDQIGWQLTTLPTPPECNTIWSDINPILALPTKIRDMVPEWSTCSMWNENIANFWFDPPIALQPAKAAASVTRPSEPLAALATPAAPSSLPSSPLAESTGAPSTEAAAVMTSTASSTVSRDAAMEVLPTASLSIPSQSNVVNVGSSNSPIVQNPGFTDEAVQTVDPVPPQSNFPGTPTEALPTFPAESDPSKPLYVYNPPNLSTTGGEAGHDLTFLNPAIATAAAFSVLTQALSSYVAEQSESKSAALHSVVSDSDTGYTSSCTLAAVQIDNGAITLGAATLAVSEIPIPITGRPTAFGTDAASRPIDGESAIATQRSAPAALVIDGKTLSVGGTVATITGQVLTVASSGLFRMATATESSSTVTETLPLVIIPSTPSLPSSSGGTTVDQSTSSSSYSGNSSAISTTSSSTRTGDGVEGSTSTTSTADSLGHRTSCTNRITWLITAAACTWMVCIYL